MSEIERRLVEQIDQLAEDRVKRNARIRDLEREIKRLREALAVIGGLLIEGRIEEAKAMTRAFDYTEPELDSFDDDVGPRPGDNTVLGV